MTHRSELINLIAKKIGAQRYLEIGVYNPDHNFNKIEVPVKVGVDPDPNAKATHCLTSDVFLKAYERNSGPLFDLVFIDGLHYADQVERDIKNAWNILAPGGVIVLHDCNPPSEATTCVPRGRQREWCGDVYKTICKITSPAFFTVDFDYGCAVIRKGNDPLAFGTDDVNWLLFSRSKEILINLKSVDQAKEIIGQWT